MLHYQPKRCFATIASEANTYLSWVCWLHLRQHNVINTVFTRFREQTNDCKYNTFVIHTAEKIRNLFWFPSYKIIADFVYTVETEEAKLYVRINMYKTYTIMHITRAFECFHLKFQLVFPWRLEIQRVRILRTWSAPVYKQTKTKYTWIQDRPIHTHAQETLTFIISFKNNHLRSLTKTFSLIMNSSIPNIRTHDWWDPQIIWHW